MDAFAFLAFYVRTMTLSAPFKLSPDNGVNVGGQNNDLQMSWLFRCVLLEGGGDGVKALDSVVICMVLRCNCSISNNVVRLAVQSR